MKTAAYIQDVHFCNWEFFIFTIKLFQTFFFPAVIWILISQRTDDGFMSFRAENKID